jgi:LysM repeat protein
MIRLLTAISVFLFSISIVWGNNVLDKQPVRVNAITDESIQMPLDIDYNLEQALTEWKRQFFKPQPCPQLAQDNISYTDTVYINRLYALPSEMELSYNPIVREYINRYTTRHRTSVQYMLGKGQYYFPMIEDIFDKYGLPLELKYLTVIESALRPDAVSRAGATGLWQFMASTGKLYGLEVNSLVDDRRDPVKATDAAARHLKDLYDIYGDWNLVIAAYNCGAGNVQKAIRRSGGLKDYWAIYPFLPRETRGYVPAFIAATYTMNYYPQHNICPMECTYPVLVDTIMVNKMLHFQQVADVLHLSIDEIRSLNPQYKKDIIPGEYKPYPLYLPSKVVSEFIVNQDSIFAYKAQTFLAHRKTVNVEGGFAANGKITKTHRIRQGESLGIIARKYGVSVAHLKRMNNLHSNNIRAGRTLVINRATVKKDVTTANSKTLAQNTAATIEQKQEPQKPEIEQSTDTISTALGSNVIADYFKQQNTDSEALSTDEALPASESDTTMLLAESIEGDTITSREYHDEDDRTIYHKVKIGETLLSISRKYNVSAIEIVSWNNLPTKKAKIGQRLMIKLPKETTIDPSELLSKNEKSDIEITTAASNVEKQPTRESPKPKEEVAKKTDSPSNVIYRVKRGDSLSVIAQKYVKVTAKDIMLANNLKSDRLNVGQKLKIPTN